jgi:hypothetical protein
MVRVGDSGGAAEATVVSAISAATMPAVKIILRNKFPSYLYE